MGEEKTQENASVGRPDRRSSLYEVFILVLTILSLVAIRRFCYCPCPKRQKNRWRALMSCSWAFVTITTVGYGDHVPVTWPGRFSAMTLMVIGVGLFSVLTSSLASWFVTDGEDQHDDIVTIKHDLEEIKGHLAAVNSELVEIKHLLEARED